MKFKYMAGLRYFSKRVKDAAKILSGMDRPGRNIAIRSDDAFLVSYPKSGNTWLRFLLANLRSEGEAVGFTGIEKLIPDIYSVRTNEFERLCSPRIIKSHEAFDPRYPKVIYIVRDPRDVLVSYYYYQIKMKKIDRTKSISEFCRSCMKGEIDQFGSWSENVSSWIAAKSDTRDFLLIKYEDMLNDTFLVLRQVCDFISIDVSDADIKQSIQISSAKNMRKIERKEGKLWTPTKNSDHSMSFVRNACAGGWRDELPRDVVEDINSAWGPLMKKLGYH